MSNESSTALINAQMTIIKLLSINLEISNKMLKHLNEKDETNTIKIDFYKNQAIEFNKRQAERRVIFEKLRNEFNKRQTERICREIVEMARKDVEINEDNKKRKLN